MTSSTSRARSKATSEPVYTIGLAVTSIETAVVALLTTAVLAADLTADAPLAVSIIGAGSALTIATGNIVGYAATRRRVSPAVRPRDGGDDGP